MQSLPLKVVNLTIVILLKKTQGQLRTVATQQQNTQFQLARLSLFAGQGVSKLNLAQHLLLELNTGVNFGLVERLGFEV
jgi:hypothetical protein